MNRLRPLLIVALTVSLVAPTGVVLAAKTKAKKKKSKPSDIFITRRQHNYVIRWQRHEKNLAGRKRQFLFYLRKKYRNTVMMQRSGRRRLYDHNIFLRGLYKGKVKHKQYGNLKERFEQAVFIDIGSAILMGKGAPTVRDLHYDKRIKPHLKAIVATDINVPIGRGRKKRGIVDRYKRRKKKLPFPVREIPLAIDTEEKWQELISEFIAEGDPIIIRAANSGPDLFYTTKEVLRHFRSVLAAYPSHEIIYFFNKFVLYKPKEESKFQRIGNIDYNVGFAHNQLRNRWTLINWRKRRLTQSFRRNKKALKRLTKKKKKKRRYGKKRKRRRRQKSRL